MVRVALAKDGIGKGGDRDRWRRGGALQWGERESSERILCRGRK